MAKLQKGFHEELSLVQLYRMICVLLALIIWLRTKYTIAICPNYLSLYFFLQRIVRQESHICLKLGWFGMLGREDAWEFAGQERENKADLSIS